MIAYFDEFELDNITKTLLNLSTSQEASSIQQGYKVIIKIANQLINKYQTTYQKIDLFESELKSLIKNWHQIKNQLKNAGQAYNNSKSYEEYLRKRTEIRRRLFNNQIQSQILEMYNIAMKFQQYINAILGQVVLTTYVWKGRANIPETYVIYNMQDFLKADVDRYGNVVVRYKNNVKMLRQHTQKLEKALENTSQFFNLNLLRETYNEAFKRYKDHQVSRGGGYILWLYPYSGQKWNGAYVSSLGSLNEAYASLVLHERFKPRNIPEDNMQQFMNVVLGVTNLAGALSGDTVVGLAEMAIKSKGATTLSIKQLYDIANEIVDKKLNNFNAIKEYLMQRKEKDKNSEQKINKSIKKELNTTEDRSVEDVLKQIKI